MALITCLECKSVISDKATSCPQCGCPIEIANDYKYSILINGVKQDATMLYEALGKYKNEEIDIYDMRQAYINWNTQINSNRMSPDDSLDLRKFITDNKIIPERWDGNGVSYREWKAQSEARREEESKPRCPKCGSTNISTGSRGVNGFWGFLGASKTVNRCANCGNTWTPRG